VRHDAISEEANPRNDATLDSPSGGSGASAPRSTPARPKQVRRPATFRRLSLRLLVIALVPALGLSIFAYNDIASRLQTAQTAARVQQRVEVLADVIELRFLVAKELVPTLALAVGPTFHLTASQLDETLGTDLVQRLAASRRLVDSMLAEHPEDVDFEAVASELTSARRGMDQGSDSPAQSFDAYSAMLVRLDQRAGGDAATTLGDVREGSAAANVRDAVLQLLTVQKASIVGTWQMPDLVGVSTGMSFMHSSPAVHLASDTGIYQSLTSTFGASLTGSTATEWQTMSTDPQVLAFERAIRDTLRGDAPQLLTDQQAAATLMRAGLHRIDRIYDLLNAADLDVRQAAVNERAEALGAVTKALLFVNGVGVLSIAVVYYVGRTVTRPLQRLARFAAAISGGDVHARRPSGRDGPVEVQTVAAAFDDVVANLQAIDAHAHALATGQLDDPVLQQPLPGQLGRSLQASVERLSQSIAEREELHGRLSHEATHDSLTGLPNRAAAMFALEASIARSNRRGAGLAVLFVDLDDFKRANDAHGHGAGDSVLREISQRLRAVARTDDTVARLGGDEFLVIVESVDSIHEVVAIGERIVESVAEPFRIDGGPEIKLGASVGVAMSVDSRTDGDTLVREADIAVYRAKEAGRGRVEVFDDAMRAQVDRRTSIEARLGHAIADNELMVAFQPVVHAETLAVCGFEALVRWREPDGTPIPPDDFIPIAEASDLIIDLDRWMLRTAVAELASWPEATEQHIHLAVNVSGRHLLDRRVVQTVADVLESTGLDPRRLMLEITETVLLSDMPVACGHLEQLRALGVTVAIDDFGSGYTSLATLRQLPVDVLKIDRSLISGLQRDRGSSLVRLIIEASQAFELGVVAEGVETEAQRTTLVELGCTQLQGWLFSPAVPAAQARALLGASHE